MFDGSLSVSRSRFTSSPSDVQPTTDSSVEDKTNVRLDEKDSSTDSDTPDGGHDGAVYPAASNNVSLPEIVSQEYPPFDAETLIVHPIMEEESSDEKFYKELGERLIESLLTFHAWAAARPRHEHNVTCELIGSKMAKIEETEKDQGRYYSTLCTEEHLPLSSFPSYHDQHRSESEIGHEHKHPVLEICPHSPPRRSFVCSRSLEQNRRIMADFVEKMKNAVAELDCVRKAL